MFKNPRLPRRLVSSLILTGVAALLMPTRLSAQENVPMVFLRPHCEQTDQTICPVFDVQDPTTLITPKLNAGDTLDMDLVLWNPTLEAINKIRIWISYDAEALEGKTIVVNHILPTVTPGEADFVALSGYAKIAAGAEPGKEPTDALLPIARLTFTVKPGIAVAGTPLSFYDQRSSTDGHTFVSTVKSSAQNLLMAPLGTLLVQFSPPVVPKASSSSVAANSSSVAASESSAVGGLPPAADTVTSSSSTSSISSAAAISSTSASSTSSASLSFGTIQVQNVRVGTKDQLLYVTWDGLNHPKLQGYNVYFGTLAGRYLQRRSVSIAARGTIIRDLPAGKTYFVAVRGVDDGNRETAFSTEASVEIGNPATASSPIIGALETIEEGMVEEIAPVNPVEHPTRPLESGVPGKSGSPSGFLLLLLGSAAVGTLLAVRRQVTAAKTLPR